MYVFSFCDFKAALRLLGIGGRQGESRPGDRELETIAGVDEGKTLGD
ncbi:MAG: hypothetical protein PHF19_09105 [Synergistales bacterium]|nr:hypothetical protein [Synergistales bacterium]